MCLSAVVYALIYHRHSTISRAGIGGSIPIQLRRPRVVSSNEDGE